jgi:hypothetical protein
MNEKTKVRLMHPRCQISGVVMPRSSIEENCKETVIAAMARCLCRLNKEPHLQLALVVIGERTLVPPI